jgi:uncharacterized protein (TIGR03435 family)
MLRALVALLPALCLAQTFDVASVKANTTGNKGSRWNVSPGGITVENMTIDQIIRAAYGLQEYQYTGPAWLENERYDINAKPPAGKFDGDQMGAMFQHLLADRFKLAVHHESKQVSGYALIVARGGLKIHPVEGEGWNFQSGKTRVVATHANPAQFAKFLAGALGRPVIDETGVKDSFTFTLEYSDPKSQEPQQTSAGDVLPSIFTILTDQLGLKLEPRKVPVDVLVVDHTERPSEN